jgi:CheY-like chemotaxis protein
LINQKVTVALLARLGCRQGVDVAANGLEALQAVQQRPYDVVLMDVHMPEMDGLAATRAIREQVSQERRPYITAITAAAMQGDAEQCLAAGMDAYVSKPVRLENLAHVLAGAPLLGASGAVPENAATVDPERTLNSL